ncbi:uncharacterized protein DUF1801 [Novosphingobium kunmingense]|uniref:Uncharacterized protein DUF1801 n=1 Tax=Novosphingobium kunmingense TaxID=1211806 RepID=A0A2N0I165_9SPHN|nr:DUF1801 domain-containing protein [Novosphingobium kunmingense]PKB24914.1 uncharacterized protein DUF1801 [Novosphingobium kunmingense]
MASSDAKTKPSDVSVADFIATVADPRRREEAAIVDALHRRVTGCEPWMWGPSIIGYGSYRYRYQTGREGTACRAGFSPRKAALSIYLMGPYCDDRSEADALFARLGKHTTGQSCLYIKKLAEVDLEVLEELVALSWQIMNARYPD